MRTDEEYKELIKNTSVVSLEPYIKARTKHLHQCKLCGDKWMVAPMNITKGKGCRICSGKRAFVKGGGKTLKIRSDEYKNTLPNKDISLLGDYVTARTPILHQCNKCNNLWNVRPDNITQGQGCPVCNIRKRDYKRYKNIPTILYLISIDGIGVKPGLTQTSVHRRYLEDVNLKYSIIDEIHYKDGWDAYKREEFILKETIKSKITWEVRPLTTGNTEIRDFTIADVIIDYFDELSNK